MQPDNVDRTIDMTPTWVWVTRIHTLSVHNSLPRNASQKLRDAIQRMHENALDMATALDALKAARDANS